MRLGKMLLLALAHLTMAWAAPALPASDLKTLKAGEITVTYPSDLERQAQETLAVAQQIVAPQSATYHRLRQALADDRGVGQRIASLLGYPEYAGQGIEMLSAFLKLAEVRLAMLTHFRLYREADFGRTGTIQEGCMRISVTPDYKLSFRLRSEKYDLGAVFLPVIYRPGGRYDLRGMLRLGGADDLALMPLVGVHEAAEVIIVCRLGLHSPFARWWNEGVAAWIALKIGQELAPDLVGQYREQALPKAEQESRQDINLLTWPQVSYASKGQGESDRTRNKAAYACSTQLVSRVLDDQPPDTLGKIVRTAIWNKEWVWGLEANSEGLCHAIKQVTGRDAWAMLLEYTPPEMRSAFRQGLYRKEPGVILGGGVLSRRAFLTEPAVGVVTDIRLGKLDGKPGTTLGIAGTKGAVFLDRSGRVASRVSFQASCNCVQMVDVNGDKVCEFMDRSFFADKASLLDHRGHVLWSYGSSSGVNDMAAGDVDGDGRPEFAVGFNGWGGVHLLDRKGKLRWRQPDANVWQVEIADVDGKGAAEILHSNSAGMMTIRDKRGKITSRVGLTARLQHFSVCRWPTAGSAQHVITAEGDTIWLFELGNTKAAPFWAPGIDPLTRPIAVPVKLAGKAPEYLAVAISGSGRMMGKMIAESMLYGFDSARTLAYAEKLPEPCMALAAIPVGNSGAQALLVGGKGRVWEYRLERKSMQ